MTCPLSAVSQTKVSFPSPALSSESTIVPIAPSTSASVFPNMLLDLAGGSGLRWPRPNKEVGRPGLICSTTSVCCGALLQHSKR
jgi:hypothetical protein